jgi:hypothetical protein
MVLFFACVWTGSWETTSILKCPSLRIAHLEKPGKQALTRTLSAATPTTPFQYQVSHKEPTTGDSIQNAQTATRKIAL